MTGYNPHTRGDDGCIEYWLESVRPDQISAILSGERLRYEAIPEGVYVLVPESRCLEILRRVTSITAVEPFCTEGLR